MLMTHDMSLSLYVMAKKVVNGDEYGDDKWPFIADLWFLISDLSPPVRGFNSNCNAFGRK